jgi:hypothetical protein
MSREKEKKIFLGTRLQKHSLNTFLFVQTTIYIYIYNKKY